MPRLHISIAHLNRRQRGRTKERNNDVGTARHCAISSKTASVDLGRSRRLREGMSGGSCNQVTATARFIDCWINVITALISFQTTLAQEMVKTGRWVRASQDDAPTRRRQECEAMVRSGLRQGKDVVVDRVGFDYQ
jgi:hypothetical protein